MNKNFNISNYNLDLIKCLQNDSGIYFILDPSKAINDKKNSEVYDIFIPENSDGVTLHVQKVNEEYKCVGVSITKKGIDINTGTRIFNTKIADWLEQLFHFNKTLTGGASPANQNSVSSIGAGGGSAGSSTGNRLKRTNSNNSITAESNSVNPSTSTVVNGSSKNVSVSLNAGNNNTGGSGSGSGNGINGGNGSGNSSSAAIINGNNVACNGKYNNYNNLRHASPGMQPSPITNLVKNAKNNFDNFDNNENYNSVMCNKKNNKIVNQANCNLSQSNGTTNSVVTHIVPSTNLLSPQTKEQTAVHQHVQQIQHAKQIRLNQMNNPHMHKSHVLPYHNANYEDKNNKLYNNINANALCNKNMPGGNTGSAQVVVSTSPNSDMVKNNKIGCTNRQKSMNHNMHNHAHGGEVYNSQNGHPGGHSGGPSYGGGMGNSMGGVNSSGSGVGSGGGGGGSMAKPQQQGFGENYGYRPTLFNLLEVLANHNITTPDQRVCIRGIVTDFLNNELPHGKIYAYIGAVVGHDILHDIIRKLEKDPNRNVVPDASGLARIEAAFGLSKSSYDFMNHNSNSSSVNNIPNVLFNHRNLNSALLNNHIYSSILSSVANNSLNHSGVNHSGVNHSGVNQSSVNQSSINQSNINHNNSMNTEQRLNLENEKLLNGGKTAADINNLLKYAKSEKYALSCNNLLNLNKKKSPNLNNLLNMRNENSFGIGSGVSGINSVGSGVNKSGGMSAHDYVCASRNLNQQCGNLNRSSVSEDEEELMKVIKKNIESYKMNNIKNILISSVFGRLKWLKVMNESPHSYLYGHSIVKFGNKLYMFGGTNNKHKKVPFNHTLTFSLIYYNYKLLPLGGNYPEERDGHTTHLISLKSGLSVFLFGGSNENIYYNDIYILDMESRKWSQRVTKGKLPLPRDQHCSLVYPAKSEHMRGEKVNLTEGVIIFGGKCLYNNNIVNLNDMWIFLFQVNTWVRINYLGEEAPIGRYGMSLVWSDTNTLCLFGGEYFDSSKNARERKLLDDMWTFKVQTALSIGGGVNSVGGNNGVNGVGGKTLSSSGSKTFLYNNSSSMEGGVYNPMDVIQGSEPHIPHPGNRSFYHNNSLATNTSIDRNTYESVSNAGGVLTNEGTCNGGGSNGIGGQLTEEKTGSLEEEREASSSIVKKIKITGEWKQESYEGKIGCRSNYSSIFITQRHNDLKGTEPKTVEKLMLLCSGITYANNEERVKIVSCDDIYVYFFSQKRWFHLRGKLYNEEFVFNARQRHVGCFFESKNVLGRANKNSVPCIFIQGGFKKNTIFGDAWLLSLTGDNPLRVHEYDASRERISTTQMPLYYFRDTHSISLLYSFCTLQKWLFGAFANLVDNCVHALSPAENVFIKYELTPEHDGMISIQDDGEGLDFNAMNRVLRMYGNYKNYDNTSLYNSSSSSGNIKKHSLPCSDFVNSSKIDDYNDENSEENECGKGSNGRGVSAHAKQKQQQPSHEVIATANTNKEQQTQQRAKQRTIENENGEDVHAEEKNVPYDDGQPQLPPSLLEKKEGGENNTCDTMTNKDNGIGEIVKNSSNQSDAGDDGTHNSASGKHNTAITNQTDDTNKMIGKKNTWNDDYYYKNYDQEYFYNENANSIFDIKYGVGFKMSFARISSSCAIMSRTINTIGIGLLSLELMNHCDAKELATPLCMWKLPNKELINRNIANKSEHRHHQKLLMSYTPFNSPSLLAEQINILGTYSGTRLLYWDFRDDMDFVVFSPVNNNIYLSSSPLSVDDIKGKEPSGRGGSGSKKRKGLSLVHGNQSDASATSKHLCVEEIKLNNRDVKRKANFNEEVEEEKRGEKAKRPKVDLDPHGTYKSNPEERSGSSGVANGEQNDENYEKITQSEGELVGENYHPGDEEIGEENLKKEKLLSSNNCDENDNNCDKKCSSSDNIEKKDEKVYSPSSKIKSYEDEQFQYYNNTLRKLNLFEYNSHLHPSISKEKYNISPIFPLWEHPKDSIDYCLSTYLYWLYLRRSTNIFLQNTLLIPTCMRRDEDNVESEGKKKKLKGKKKKGCKQGNNNNTEGNKGIKENDNKEGGEVVVSVDQKDVNANGQNAHDDSEGANHGGDASYRENNVPEEDDDKNNPKDERGKKGEEEVEGENGKGEEEVAIDNLEKQETNETSNHEEILPNGDLTEDNHPRDEDTENTKNTKRKVEKEDDEEDANGLTKSEKKKLEEALEYGISQEGSDIKDVRRCESDESAEEQDEDEDDDEEGEENEEEGEDDGDADVEGVGVEGEEVGEGKKQDNGEHNNTLCDGDEDKKEMQQKGEENDVKAGNGEVCVGGGSQDEGNQNHVYGDNGEETKKAKGKNKIEKTENNLGNKKRIVGAGGGGATMHNIEMKNEESDKTKKENYVNVYMENLKIKDEYYINNTNKYTLYNFLRRKLYKMVEFHYLFTPSDYEYGSFIMMGFLNDNNSVSIEVNRVCETGILLYYKNRLIKRLDAPFIDSAYNLSLAKYPPNPSLYEGNLYKYALTVIVNVPNWLKPSISKQEFIHENNYAFLLFKKKLVSLIKYYLNICEDNVKLRKWRESRDLKLKKYLEQMQYSGRRSRSDSDYEYEKAYKIIYNDKEHMRKEDVEKEAELEREENRKIVRGIEEAQKEKRKRENDKTGEKDEIDTNVAICEEAEVEVEEDLDEQHSHQSAHEEKQKNENELEEEMEEVAEVKEDEEEYELEEDEEHKDAEEEEDDEEYDPEEEEEEEEHKEKQDEGEHEENDDEYEEGKARKRQKRDQHDGDGDVEEEEEDEEEIEHKEENEGDEDDEDDEDDEVEEEEEEEEEEKEEEEEDEYDPEEDEEHKNAEDEDEDEEDEGEHQDQGEDVDEEEEEHYVDEEDLNDDEEPNKFEDDINSDE
ncbi:conserved Plasmodium protein, unknown function [Plasmodium ovale]|uniref:Kelch domain-containing protein n=1 Tax=Plasmodium ovale TaxID=36330 RepID=A0A1D3TKV9_PLAOA|nr:conserved Plasmodium protein, unknown function [Plasmodium ovale]